MIETKQIKYTDGYKYMLEEDAWFYTGIKHGLETKRVIHFDNGWMLVKEGFCWDGASGCTWDDKTNMRAALAHDGLYYLHRRGFPLEYREMGDQLLYDLMVKDGSPRWRAAYYKWAVKKFGRSSAAPKNLRKILISP